MFASELQPFPIGSLVHRQSTPMAFSSLSFALSWIASFLRHNALRFCYLVCLLEFPRVSHHAAAKFLKFYLRRLIFRDFAAIRLRFLLSSCDAFVMPIGDKGISGLTTGTATGVSTTGSGIRLPSANSGNCSFSSMRNPL